MKDIRILNKYWIDKIRQLEESKHTSLPNENLLKGCVKLECSSKYLSAITRLANNNSIAEYTVYLSLFCALLRKYIRNEQIWIAAPSLNLNDESVTETLLLYKLDVQPTHSIKDIVNITRSELQSTLIYQHIDFSEIKEHLRNNNVDMHTAFQFCFSYSSVSIKTDLVEYSGFHLDIQKENGTSVLIHIHYDQRRYDGDFAKMFAQHYLRMLEELEELLPKTLADASLISSFEKKKLLQFAGEHKEVMKKSICELIDEQEKRFPEKAAVVYDSTIISYSDLNRKANHLAIALKKKYGAQEGNFVGVLTDYSDLTIIAFLATLKLGCFYVPIDPSLPAERIQFIMEDSVPEVMLIHSNYLDKVILYDVPLFNLDLELEEEIKDVDDQLLIPPLACQGGYVMYTSGSTGKPKGVLVGEKGIVRLVKNTNYISLDSSDNLLAVSNSAFDGSTFDIWGALLNGGTLVIPERNLVHNFQSVQEAIATNKVTVLFITTALFNALVDNSIEAFAPLKKILFGGEMVSVRHVNSFMDRYGKGKLLHVYGPTENTTFSTWFPVDEKIEPGKTVPIGKSISYTSCYILDEKLEMQPIGVAGELYVGGEGLAIEYLHDETLTAAKFISNPYLANTRIYKTGDLCKWLPDGNIEILDRMDNQVKIRGYRIELGEIECKILSYPGINEATVLVKSDQSNVKFLIAFYVAAEEIDNSQLRNELQRSLPDYMIPVDLIRVEALPLNQNGKIDKKALLQYEYVADTAEINELPVSETEAKLIVIWQKLFGRQNIRVTDSFFDVGGHSLLATELVSLIHKQMGVKIEVRHVFIEQTIERLAVVIDNSRQETFVAIKPVSESWNGYALSSAQRRLWVLSQFEGGSVAYNIPVNIFLNEDIDIECFKRAIDAVVERHEILRTVFRADESGETRQWVLKREDVGFRIDYKDFRKAENKDEMVKEYISSDSYKAFDLEKGPLLRFALLQVEDKGYVFYFNMHHIISDGWSMEVLRKDVFYFHEFYKKNKKSDPTAIGLKELRIQYKDYSAWQLAQLDEDSFKAHREYWLNSLSGELPLLDLPRSKQRPRIKSNNGCGISTNIDQHITGKLKTYSEKNGGTLFMGLLAAWNVLMYRYTSQKDIIIGTPIAGREHADLEDQIGFYVNTLALRNEIKGEESFNELFSRIKQNTLNAYCHQIYPFDRLIEELDLQRDTSRSAIFDISITYHNRLKLSEKELLNNSLVDQITSSGPSKVKFDIELHFQEVDEYLSFNLIYNQDVYDADMITTLMGHYKELLKSLVSHPEERVGYVDYLSEKEKCELLLTFNDTAVTYPKDKTIVDLFEEQVEKTPDNVALIFEEKELSYRELNKLSNQLACHLRGHYGITREDLVGIQLQRSEWVIVSILAILKSGGAYVPIDPEYPVSRKRHIIEDTCLKLLITEADFVLDLDYYAGPVFAIDVEFEGLECSSNSLKVEVTTDNLAYVMYTSGSTGMPKGVMVEQKSVVRLVKNSNIYSFSSSDKLLSTGALSFDATTFEYWGPLLNGGQLVLCSQGILLDRKLLTEEIKSKSINIMWFTSGLLTQLVDSEISIFSTLTTLLAGGDRLSPLHIEKLKVNYPALEIINGYGPTEGTTFSITHNISEVTGEIPIGKPISNTQVYILSEEGGLQPKGVIGEIYIGGEGLSRGYLNQENLTKEKFITSPFKVGERLYKTGDLGRWTKEGTIEFIGRRDAQVKIRGYRIELGEIEHALKNHREIDETVVLAKENQHKEKDLVAYITSKSAQNTSELRSYLKDILPEYMLPSHYVQLEEFPLTVNGKIDRKSLLESQGLGLSSGVEYVAPRNAIEEKLVKIWKEVLQREHIGIEDDFFALGGHSLKAVRLSNEYQKELGVKISLKDLFASTSIASHLELIHSSEKAAFIRIEKVAEQKSYAISDAQRRLWVLSQFEGGSVAYNIPVNIFLNEDIDIGCFKRAIDAVIERHEILRTVFRADESGETRQWVLKKEDVGFRIDYKDFRKAENKDEMVKEYISSDSYKAFDLEKGPLLRFALLQVEDKGYVFYFNMHHIISDGWSMEVLRKDVFYFHEFYKKNKKSDPTAIGLKELRIQYKDYSAWQLAQLEKESFKAHKNYWMKNLSGKLPLFDLPFMKKRPALRRFKGGVWSSFIDNHSTALLREICMNNKGTIFQGMLTSWLVLMYKYSGNKDLIIGTSVSGRSHLDLHNQIGYYSNSIALRNEINPDSDFTEVLKTVIENTNTSMMHQDYPFNQLVTDMELKREANRNPLFDMMIVLINSNEVTADGYITHTEITHAEATVKFDLELSIRDLGSVLAFGLIYDADIFDKSRVENMILDFKHILNELLNKPDLEIENIDIEDKWTKEVKNVNLSKLTSTKI